MENQWILRGLGVIVSGALFKFGEVIYGKLETLVEGTWKYVKAWMKDHGKNDHSLFDTICTLIGIVKQDIRKCDFCRNKCVCKRNSKGKWYCPGCA